MNSVTANALIRIGATTFLASLLCCACKPTESSPSFVVGYEQTDTIPLPVLMRQTNFSARIEEVKVVERDPKLRVLVVLSTGPGRKLAFYEDGPTPDRLAALQRLKGKGTIAYPEALRGLPP